MGKSITILLPLTVFIGYTQAYVKLCDNYAPGIAQQPATLEEEKISNMRAEMAAEEDRMENLRAEMQDEEKRLENLKAEMMAEENRLERLKRKMRAQEQKLEQRRADRMEGETRAETKERDAFLINMLKAEARKDEIATKSGAIRNAAARKRLEKQEEAEDLEGQGFLRKEEEDEGLTAQRFLEEEEGGSLAASNNFEANKGNIDAMEEKIFAGLQHENV